MARVNSDQLYSTQLNSAKLDSIRSTHSLNRSLTHSLTCSLTTSLTYSLASSSMLNSTRLTHPLAHLLHRSLPRSISHSLTRSLTHPLMFSPTPLHSVRLRSIRISVTQPNPSRSTYSLTHSLTQLTRLTHLTWLIQFSRLTQLASLQRISAQFNSDQATRLNSTRDHQYT